MIDQNSTATPNHLVLALVHALLGLVSPNFRMVALKNDGEVWRLQFVLETDSEMDREAIDDVATEFESLLSHGIRYEIEITITAGEISWPSAPTRVVFRRREMD